MLATIAIIILILWALGAFVVPVGGALIHILLVIGLIVLVVHFLRGRGRAI
ncbi:lmo0937 family membrane protein [Sphingomonas sp. ASV193]|uniref:lmo0937 family membrane protein n=1 Tax=Sphingomonas sp. ASV193 TaxID=3144405 RepID=UPI0032E8CE2F